MKLRDIVRKHPNELKIKTKADKRKKRDDKDEDVEFRVGGSGDNAVRGLNDDEGYIQ